MPPILPAQFDVFAGEVVPILQRRGLFRTEYTGSMLRDHYGLRWPASVFDDPACITEPLAAAAGCVSGYFTSRATPLRKIKPPTSQPNFAGSTRRITRSPSQEPMTTNGKPIAISATLDPS